MKTFFYNLGYFFLETFRMLRFHAMSNSLSVLGTGLILFLLGLAVAGGAVGNTLIGAIEKEAQVSAYFKKDMDEGAALKLTEKIKEVNGVMEAAYINKEAAYEQGREMLGKEAEVLELFSENPFEAYIDISIHLGAVDGVLEDLSRLEGLEYVRDNREILEKIEGIVGALGIFGLLVGAAVGITTLVTISHMIRQGIYNNRGQIGTLKLLGAPNSFIGFPFVLAGTLMTLMGGVLAAVMLLFLISRGYSLLSSSLLFLPMPPLEELRSMTAGIILAVSAGLGLAGSFFGLLSVRRQNGSGM